MTTIRSVSAINAAFRRFAKTNGIRIKRGLPQNQQPCDTRMAYCDFIDYLYRNGEITESLADRTTYY